MIRKLIREIIISKKNSGPSFESDNMNLLFSDNYLRITSLGDSSAPNLFLCFTGVEQAMGGIGTEEFVGSTKMEGFEAIFISDLRRSWYNAFPSSHLINALAGKIEGRHIVSVGNSMGGYGAIWATQYIPITTSIAFAPQFSVHPEVVPEEQRWQQYRREITKWRDRSLAGYFNDETRYVTINGDADRLHWSNFPPKPNCAHILLRDTGHNPAAALKRSGLLTPTIQACINGRDPMTFLAHSAAKAESIKIVPPSLDGAFSSRE